MSSLRQYQQNKQHILKCYIHLPLHTLLNAITFLNANFIFQLNDFFFNFVLLYSHFSLLSILLCVLDFFFCTVWIECETGGDSFFFLSFNGCTHEITRDFPFSGWNFFHCSACGLRQIKFYFSLHFHYFNFILREPYWKCHANRSIYFFFIYPPVWLHYPAIVVFYIKRGSNKKKKRHTHKKKIELNCRNRTWIE